MARVMVALPGLRAAALSFMRGVTVNPTQAETTALLAAMAVQPSQDRANLINNTIFSLKDAGIWTKLDWLHGMAAHDSQASLLDWKNPASPATVAGTCTFTVDRGWQGDGTTGYIDTARAYNGQTNFKQNDCHLGAWIANEAGVPAGHTAIGIPTTASKILLQPRSSNTFSSRLNCSTAFAIANSVSKGHSLITRASAATYDAYKNASLLGASAQTSTALTAENFVYLRNVSNYTSLWQIAAGHGGSSLTATEITNLYNALNTYMMAVGAA